MNIDNFCQFYGRLTRDPEFYQGAEPGKDRVKFSIAVKRVNGTDPDFIDCIAFGRMAQVINQYFTKGRAIRVAGHIQIESYEKDGIKRKSTTLYIDGWGFGGDKSGTAAPSDQGEPLPHGLEAAAEDIPF